MIAKQRLKLKRGDDHTFKLSLKQAGEPFDLSQVKSVDLQAVYQRTEVLNLSTENGLIEVLEEGQILLHFPHRLTQNERWISAEYDLQLTFNDDRVKTVLEGQIDLSHDITKVRG